MYLIPVKNNGVCVQIRFIIIHFAILSSAIDICPVMKNITPKLQRYTENCVHQYQDLC